MSLLYCGRGKKKNKRRREIISLPINYIYLRFPFLHRRRSGLVKYITLYFILCQYIVISTTGSAVTRSRMSYIYYIDPSIYTPIIVRPSPFFRSETGPPLEKEKNNNNTHTRNPSSRFRSKISPPHRNRSNSRWFLYSHIIVICTYVCGRIIYNLFLLLLYLLPDQT